MHMQKYIKIFKLRLAVGLEYRADILGNLFLDLISLASIIILWFAIYRERPVVAGYTFHDAMFYYLVLPMIGSFTEVFTSDEVGYEIRDGTLSTYLLKPFVFQYDMFCRAVASKINYLVVTFPILFVILSFFSLYLHITSITLSGFLLAVVAVFGAFLLDFFFDTLIAWLAFWIVDIWTFRHFKYIICMFFGGLLFPIEFTSGLYRVTIELLPFKYFYYVPAAYLLGKRGIESLPMDILGIAVWSIIFIVLGQLLWKAGIKKYEAYGG